MRQENRIDECKMFYISSLNPLFFLSNRCSPIASLDKWWHRAAIERTSQGKPEHVKIRKEYSRIEPQSDEQLREIIQNYYGQISLIDNNVGRILTALEESGLADNTIVIYTSDHGDWLGDHGLVLKGPMHYEGLLRVGLIARGPGVPAGKVVQEPVSTLDLAPTFMDYAQAEPLGTLHGQSLRDLIETDTASREYAYNEWELLANRVGVQLSLRTVRTKTHKLTLELGSGAGELYDLVNDPHEMVNCFDDPAYATIRAELTAMIAERPDDAGSIRQPVGAA